MTPPSIPRAQLVIRLILELGMLAGFAWWGWTLGGGGPLRIVLAIAFPLTAAVCWGAFTTPGDPSRGKDGPVAVPGAVRLGLELGLFLLCAYGIWTSGSRAAAETLLTFVALHYLLLWERARWLVQAGSGSGAGR